MTKTKKGKDRNADRPTRVLLVEDESSFVEALQIGLGNEGSRSPSPSTAPRRSSSSTRSPLTSCCSI